MRSCPLSLPAMVARLPRHKKGKMDLGLLLGALPDVGRQASLAADPFNPSALLAMAKHDRRTWESKSKMAAHIVHKSFTGGPLLPPRCAAAAAAAARHGCQSATVASSRQADSTCLSRLTESLSDALCP